MFNTFSIFFLCDVLFLNGFVKHKMLPVFLSFYLFALTCQNLFCQNHFQ